MDTLTAADTGDLATYLRRIADETEKATKPSDFDDVALALRVAMARTQAIKLKTLRGGG